MDQRSRSIVAPKKVTPRQVEVNNGRSNHPLPSNQRNLQRQTDRSNIRFRLAPAPIDRSSSILSTNRRRVDHVERMPSSLQNDSELTCECAICLLHQANNQFEQQYSHECEHIVRSICDTCVYNYIRSVLEDNINSVIICPERHCQSPFSFQMIRLILNTRNNIQLFERYDRHLAYGHLEQLGEFVWCAHNGCGSGQLHDMGSYANPMVVCIKCHRRTCGVHRIQWHVGMTCEEYDQLKISSADDDQTQVWLKKYSKKCPKCQSPIEKISGCDHMTCRKCFHQFCWQCFADYRKILNHGSKYHQKHCLHYPPFYRSNHFDIRPTSRTCTIL